MATITAVVTKVEQGNPNAWIATWSAVGNADTGTAVSLALGSEKSVQMVGTWASATIVLQGSNDGTNWAALTDPQGNAISKTADALEAVSEHTRYIRVSSSGGAGTNVNVIVFVKGQIV